MKNIVGLLLLTLFLVCVSESARILSVTFFGSKSFRNAFDPLHYELAQRGHNLTIINPIPSTKPHVNIREINLPAKKESPLKTFRDFFHQRQDKKIMNIMLVGPQIIEACHQFLQMEQVQSLIQEEKFDLILGVGIGNECSFGYIHQFKTPFIILSPITPAFHVSAMAGAPAPVSFVPNIFTGLADRMTLLERVHNFVSYLWYSIFFHTTYAPQMDAVNREYYGQDTPSVMDIAKEMSLMLVASHFSVNYLRPFMSDMIDIGGLYCQQEAKPLPTDILDFINSSGSGSGSGSDPREDGFIYFSMGSILQGSALPEKLRQTFVSVFRKLKLKVLWKWETESMEEQPGNVKLLKWAPQQDILAHPKIRLFISHAGGLSTSEATWNGVPVLGIPMFGDQDYNIQMVENKGYGLKLELGDITEATLMDRIQRILSDTKYAEKAKTLSKIFRDSQVPALETAVYWTEYVLRHDGAPHLRSPARDLNFVQYYSVDVMSLLLVAFALLLYLLLRISKLIFNLFRTEKRKAD